MKKIALRGFIIVIITLVLSSVGDFKPDNTLMNTIFTVSGIMFSIGLGLIVNFNLQEVRNAWYIRKIRINLNKVRNSFIFFFALSTASFLMNEYLGCLQFSFKFVHFDLSIFFLIMMLFSIVYYIVNLIDLQKLNNDIVDKLNKEENEKLEH